MEKATWTVKEFKEAFGFSVPTAYKYTEIAGFPVIRVGRKKLIMKDAVEKWMLEHPDALKDGVYGRAV